MSDSLITKAAIAESIKELMKKKNLAKITVSDIVQNCGLNRQTFYYHFRDKYDLVKWIYYHEVVVTLSNISANTDWSAVLLDVLNIMKAEKTFYTGALNADRQNIFHNYLFNATKEILLKIIDELFDDVEKGHKMGVDDRIFIAEFYTYGLVGMVIQWAKNGMKFPPEEIVGRLKHFIDDSKRVSVARYLKEFVKEDNQCEDLSV